MAASATPRIAEPVSRCIAVAYSGGRDSTALLHATARQAQAAGLQVLALHVHHGLSPHADAWAAHCEQQCAAWAATGLPLRLQWRRIEARPAAAQSVEAWAREQRYAALSEMAQAAGADLLLLAQHRRDQAETLLLQALRGAGVAGLAGMPALQWRGGLCWARPWLEHPREAIEAYLAAHALSHIEDDSNTELRFARNRLRLSVWPALQTAFPQAEQSIAQAATWAQQALALQQEVAQSDLLLRVDDAGLDMSAVARLSPARASNALRAWLHAQTGQPAPASLLRRLQLEWTHAACGKWPCAGGQLRLYRGRLSWAAQDLPMAPPPAWLDLRRVGEHVQSAWRGAWQVFAVEQGGVAAERLQRLGMRARQGGEQFQQAPARNARSLKKAYQEAAIPAWQRQGPLLFAADGILLFAPGLGLDARQRAAAGEPQFSLAWRSAPG